MVVEAVKEDRLFVFTDRAAIGMIQAQTEAILDAMPEESRDDEDFGTFRDSIHGSSGGYET